MTKPDGTISTPFGDYGFTAREGEADIAGTPLDVSAVDNRDGSCTHAYEFDRASITLNGKPIGGGPLFDPDGWPEETLVRLSADYTATITFRVKTNAQHRRFWWKLRHAGKRAGRRQPHMARVARFTRWLVAHPQSPQAAQLARLGKVRLGRHWLHVVEG
jgi:hypothetical protein